MSLYSCTQYLIIAPCSSVVLDIGFTLRGVVGSIGNVVLIVHSSRMVKVSSVFNDPIGVGCRNDMDLPNIGTWHSGVSEYVLVHGPEVCIQCIGTQYNLCNKCSSSHGTVVNKGLVFPAGDTGFNRRAVVTIKFVTMDR